MPRYKQNDGEHIDEIIDRVDCAKHNAAKGFPCFKIYYDNGRVEHGPGICGTRVTKAGFNGKIQPSSLSQKTKDRESRPRR